MNMAEPLPPRWDEMEEGDPDTGAALHGGTERNWGLTPHHHRVLEAAREQIAAHGLCLAGGYALRAHDLTDRPCAGLHLATARPDPLPEVAREVAASFDGTGLAATVTEVTPRTARLTVTDEVTGQECALDLMREALQDEPTATETCPVAGLGDAVGLKVRALHDRGLARDFIDVHAAAHLYGFRELERLGALHDDDFRLATLVERLEGVDLPPDDAFAAHGLGADRADEVRRFAHAWAEDVKLRRSEDGDLDEPDFDVPEVD